MSARLTAQQNKIRLISIFLFTLMLGLGAWVYQGQFHANGSGAVSNAETLDDSLFMGLRHVPAPEVRQVLPAASGKPAVLYFGSRLCHDCQRMSPVVLQTLAQYPNIYFKKLDVLDDQNKEPAILRTFKPVIVPMTVLINPKGEIRNVLYDYQKPEVVKVAIASLLRQSVASEPNPKAKKEPLKKAE